MSSALRSLTFENFRLNVATRELFRVNGDGTVVPVLLGSRAGELLLVFLHRAGALVTKTEILAAVWPNTAVEDSNLSVQISALRRVLDAGRNGTSCIQTVPGRGYRFTPAVLEQAEPKASAPLPTRKAPVDGVANSAPPLVASLPWPALSITRYQTFKRALASACVVALIGAVGAVFLGPARWFGSEESTAPSRPASVPAEGSRQPDGQRRLEALVPETIPFVSDRERNRIRSTYLPAPGHKAIAISSAHIGLITGQRDEETAKSAALSACRQSGSRDIVQCELYALDDTVVWTRGTAPLPPQPWLVRDASVERPFAAGGLPLVSLAVQKKVESGFAKGARSRALALSARGHVHSSWNAASVDEAVRRSLEGCGLAYGIACLVVAVDDMFVVPIPTSMKVVGFSRLSPIDAIAPEAREDVKRRLANATGWSAVAIGVSGRPGLKLSAGTEQAAVDGALSECSQHDHECRVIVIGPFLVAAMPTARTR